jgi:hypothetical protein
MFLFYHILASLYQAWGNRILENTIVGEACYPPMHARVGCVELELDVAEGYADRKGQVDIDEA